MFKCSHCKTLSLIQHIERDHSDWIVVCPQCQTKNILAITRIDRVLVPVVEVLGWRD